MNAMRVEARPLEAVRYAPPMGDPDEQVKVSVTLRRDELEKFYAWMERDTWEKVRAAREAKLQDGPRSLAALLNTALRHVGTSGGRVCAQLLANLYNGDRVKFDLTDLKRLDQELFEHAMNAIRLCVETMTEPHAYFENGGDLFERLIADWGLEKKRRAR